MNPRSKNNSDVSLEIKDEENTANKTKKFNANAKEIEKKIKSLQQQSKMIENVLNNLSQEKKIIEENNKITAKRAADMADGLKKQQNAADLALEKAYGRRNNNSKTWAEQKDKQTTVSKEANQALTEQLINVVNNQKDANIKKANDEFEKNKQSLEKQNRTLQEQIKQEQSKLDFVDDLIDPEAQYESLPALKRINDLLYKIADKAEEVTKEVANIYKNVQHEAVKLVRSFDASDSTAFQQLFTSLQRAFTVMDKPNDIEARNDLKQHASEMPGKSTHWDNFKRALVKLANVAIKVLTLGKVSHFYKNYTESLGELAETKQSKNAQHDAKQNTKNDATEKPTADNAQTEQSVPKPSMA